MAHRYIIPTKVREGKEGNTFGVVSKIRAGAVKELTTTCMTDIITTLSLGLATACKSGGLQL